MSRKSIKNLISLIIAAALVVALCGCSKNDSFSTNNDIYLDNIPEFLDYNGENVRISYWDNSFVKSELVADNDDIDFIDSAILERNKSIEDRLGVKLEFIKGDNAPEYYMPAVQEEILAGSFDCDIISGVQCQTGVLCINGCYLDLSGAKYLDLSKPYWSHEYINELRIGNNGIYMLGGDISLTTTAWSSAILVDEDIYNETFGDVEQLYNDVLAGKWTLDMMFERSRDAYKDLNSNGERDNKDRYGFSLRMTGNSIFDMFCFSSGVRYSLRDQENYPILNVVNNDSVEFCKKFCDSLTSNPGIWCYSSSEHKGASSDSLFITTTLDALRDDNYQSSMGVIPFPKLNSAIYGYHSWLSDNTLVYSVPVTLVNDRENMISAVLEVMASETRRICLPAYYETALGDAYIGDEWTMTMLDIIHDGASADFVSIYSISLDHVGGIMRQQVGYLDPDFETNYNSIYPDLPNKLNSLIQTFNRNTASKYVPYSSASNDINNKNFFPENQIDDSWSVFGVKYRNSGIIIPRDLSDSFSYVLNENKGISVSSPSVKVEPGSFPTAAIQSRDKLNISDFNVSFNTDPGFTYNNVGYSASASVFWSTMPITEMPQYTDQIGTNGLREAIPAEEGAYALSVVFMGTKNTSGSVSDLMYIILHDGTSAAPEDDNRIGYRWTNYVNTDLSEGVTIKLIEDNELGFVVSVNNIEYRTGLRGNDELPIDLNVLKDTDPGHICIGVGVTGPDEAANFTLNEIDGVAAGEYFE